MRTTDTFGFLGSFGPKRRFCLVRRHLSRNLEDDVTME